MTTIPIIEVQGRLLVSLQGELTDGDSLNLQQDLLARLAASPAAGVVIEVSSLELIDSFVARMLADTAQGARLMGSEVVVAGIQPAIAMTLVELGLELKGLRTALNLDHALEVLAR